MTEGDSTAPTHSRLSSTTTKAPPAPAKMTFVQRLLMTPAQRTLTSAANTVSGSNGMHATSSSGVPRALQLVTSSSLSGTESVDKRRAKKQQVPPPQHAIGKHRTMNPLDALLRVNDSSDTSSPAPPANKATPRSRRASAVANKVKDNAFIYGQW